MVEPKPVDAVEHPTTVEVDVRKLQMLEGAKRELHATQTVLAVMTERLMKLTHAEAITVEKAAFENPPDLTASRDKDSGEVTVTVSR